MAFELFARVALREDFPRYKLCRGDVASNCWPTMRFYKSERWIK
jgi:hypothetical protein